MHFIRKTLENDLEDYTTFQILLYTVWIFSKLVHVYLCINTHYIAVQIAVSKSVLQSTCILSCVHKILSEFDFSPHLASTKFKHITFSEQVLNYSVI